MLDDRNDVIDIWPQDRDNEGSMVVAGTRSAMSGFSIAELLVSIAIFVFITAMTLWGFRGAGQANNLRQSAADLVGTLRRAQSLASTGAFVAVCKDGSQPPTPCTQDLDCNPNLCGEVPLGGFGLTLVGAAPSTQYELFADLNHGGTSVGAYGASEDALVPQSRTTMIDRTSIISMTRNAMAVTSTTFTPTGVAAADTHNTVICLRHPNINNVFRRITVIPVTGQVNEESVSTCP